MSKSCIFIGKKEDYLWNFNKIQRIVEFSLLFICQLTCLHSFFFLVISCLHFLCIHVKLSSFIEIPFHLSYFDYFQVQAHGSDAMVDEENCVFFLPHRPRSQILEPPIFLFMKGTGKEADKLNFAIFPYLFNDKVQLEAKSRDLSNLVEKTIFKEGMAGKNLYKRFYHNTSKLRREKSFGGLKCGD